MARRSLIRSVLRATWEVGISARGDGGGGVDRSDLECDERQ